LPDGWAWRELPDDDPRLRGFEWFEAPGLNGMDAGQRKRLLEWCGRVDGVLMVIHRANPWEASSWDMLAHFDPSLLDRTLVVLQQIDRGDPADLPVLRNHLRELSVRKIGRELPVVPVSAARAWQAWQAGEVPEARPWGESGFAGLEREIRERLCETPERFRELRSWWSRTVEVLREAEDRIEEGARAVEGEARFVAEVESEVDASRERMAGQLGQEIPEFERSALRVRGWFARRLGILPSFVRCLAGDHSAVQLDRMLVRECAAEARQRAEIDADLIEGECARLWGSLEPRTRERLGLDVGGFEPVRGRLVEARERFIEGCMAAAAQRAADIRPSSLLVEDLRSRRRLLTALFGVVLVLAAAGGIAGATGHSPIDWWLLGAAGVAGIGAAVAVWASRRVILRSLDEVLLDGVAGLGPDMHGRRVDELRGYFAHFSRSLDPLRRRVAGSRGELQPMLEQWNGLFLELQAVGQEMG
jgi:hypothetical protein